MLIVRSEIKSPLTEFFQLFSQQLLVPGSLLSKTVVCNHESPTLGLRQMMDANRRYVLETQALGSLNSAVAREDSLCSVNHDGPEEAKAIDAFCELSDLPMAVNQIGRETWR